MIEWTTNKKQCTLILFSLFGNKCFQLTSNFLHEKENWIAVRIIIHISYLQLIVALNEKEIPRLDQLLKRGQKNGVKDLQVLDAKGIREMEPNCVVCFQKITFWVGIDFNTWPHFIKRVIYLESCSYVTHIESYCPWVLFLIYINIYKTSFYVVQTLGISFLNIIKIK